MKNSVKRRRYDKLYPENEPLGIILLLLVLMLNHTQRTHTETTEKIIECLTIIGEIVLTYINIGIYMRMRWHAVKAKCSNIRMDFLVKLLEIFCKFFKSKLAAQQMSQETTVFSISTAEQWMQMCGLAHKQIA
uniref:Uncharacterized protein n=1 Tax=Glossina pallidipes TaxID=7398 RepID=A0A1B0ABL6_GLOPL